VVQPRGLTALAPLHMLRRAEPFVALAKEGNRKSLRAVFR
jgi:hypothetical protein